jgi:RNA polymerase-interacting CarD/CdnL/TRCF family regulator
MSFAVSTRYEALCRLLENELADKVKTLGFYNCNISNAKLEEVLTILRRSKSLQSLDISDNINVLNKTTIKAIAELYNSLPKKTKL